jgi:hypothetical protein
MIIPISVSQVVGITDNRCETPSLAFFDGEFVIWFHRIQKNKKTAAVSLERCKTEQIR